MQSDVALWLFNLHTANGSVLAEKLIHILVLEGIWELFNPQISERATLLSLFSFVLGHFLVLSIVAGHNQSVWELLHALVVPGFHAKLGSLLRIKVNERKLLGPGSNRIKEYTAADDEILHNHFLFLFFLDAIVPQNEIQLLNDVLLPTKRVDQSDVNTSLWVVISVLLVKEHVKLLGTELQDSIENYAMSHLGH